METFQSSTGGNREGLHVTLSSYICRQGIRLGLVHHAAFLGSSRFVQDPELDESALCDRVKRFTLAMVHARTSRGDRLPLHFYDKCTEVLRRVKRREHAGKQACGIIAASWVGSACPRKGLRPALEHLRKLAVSLVQ